MVKQEVKNLILCFWLEITRNKQGQEKLLRLVTSGVGEVVPVAAHLGAIKTLHKYLDQNPHEVKDEFNMAPTS